MTHRALGATTPAMGMLMGNAICVSCVLGPRETDMSVVSNCNHCYGVLLRRVRRARLAHAPSPPPPAPPPPASGGLALGVALVAAARGCSAASWLKIDGSAASATPTKRSSCRAACWHAETVGGAAYRRPPRLAALAASAASPPARASLARPRPAAARRGGPRRGGGLRHGRGHLGPAPRCDAASTDALDRNVAQSLFWGAGAGRGWWLGYACRAIWQVQTDPRDHDEARSVGQRRLDTESGKRGGECLRRRLSYAAQACIQGLVDVAQVDRYLTERRSSWVGSSVAITSTSSCTRPHRRWAQWHMLHRRCSLLWLVLPCTFSRRWRSTGRSCTHTCGISIHLSSPSLPWTLSCATSQSPAGAA